LAAARSGALLERLLGVIRSLDCDGLEALGHRAEGLHRCVHVVLADLLYVFKILDHVVDLSGRQRPPVSVPLSATPTNRAVLTIYIALHNNVKTPVAAQ